MVAPQAKDKHKTKTKTNNKESTVAQMGEKERETQKRIVQFFQQHLNYRYLGDLTDKNNQNIEENQLKGWLTKRNDSPTLINNAIKKLKETAVVERKKDIYSPNQAVYSLLRNGVKVKDQSQEKFQTVWLIDWKNPSNNDFAIAEEVSIEGELKKRPDLVIYVNGIALGVIELKRASVHVSEGIRQNLLNQKSEFIAPFFTTMQLVMAGNDTQGIRYGTIKTPEKYYLEWKEDGEYPYQDKLEFDLNCLCSKKRFLEIIHDFILFDAGIKKTCRPNQFFGVQKTKAFIERRENGIIWHTQGSGKSLTMVWLAKWIKENITDSRVLIITDRTELDEQIETVFDGVGESIIRTKSGADLLARLNKNEDSLLCSLIHKFGARSDESDEKAADNYAAEILKSLPADFKAKGDFFVFVDECHRTQSGKMHEAMTIILPKAMFVGFTGTPLLKKDKKKSIEVFGKYIHTYKFNEAIPDGVVLDLAYEAREINQELTSQKNIDDWFARKTQGLSRIAQNQLKQKWGTMQKVLSSKGRQERIHADILMDMERYPRLKSGRGNAILVCSSVYEACVAFKLFEDSDLEGKVGIVTSYQPTPDKIKNEVTGEGKTEEQVKYDTYLALLAKYFDADKKKAAGMANKYEEQVKEAFIKRPAQMKLLIVVDKLLTGFDAPACTYLYIDKQMADHNLFQAICRVNRLDGEDKQIGYIIDYKDLFKSLKKAIEDYTGEAFGDFDENDIKGLLKNRIKQGKEALNAAREMVKALCEPVLQPRELKDYMDYFYADPTQPIELQSEKEALRLSLYQSIAKYLRAFANLANDMSEAGFSEKETATIKQELRYYEELRNQLKIATGDMIDLKQYEPGMRKLIDLYIRADDVEKLSDLDDLSLLDLVVNQGVEEASNKMPGKVGKDKGAMAEAVENNIRKTIVDEMPINPKYYETMSVLLDELIQMRKSDTKKYQKYLERIRDLARKVKYPESGNSYPKSIDTAAKRAFYDNFGKDEALAIALDEVILKTKKADWIGNHIKERSIKFAIIRQFGEGKLDIDKIMQIAKSQKEYK